MCIRGATWSSRPNKPRTSHPGEGVEGEKEKTKGIRKNFNKGKSITFGSILA